MCHRNIDNIILFCCKITYKRTCVSFNINLFAGEHCHNSDGSEGGEDQKSKSEQDREGGRKDRVDDHSDNSPKRNKSAKAGEN